MFLNRCQKICEDSCLPLLRFEYWPVTIKKWDETNILPLGDLAHAAIGEAGDAEAEVMKALAENELDDHNVDFSDEILNEVLIKMKHLCRR